MSDFRNILEASGLRPRAVVPDGRWYRCATDDKPKKRNGAYSLSLDGLRGWWRNWATDLDLNEWRGDDVRSAVKRLRDEELERRRRDQERGYRVQAMKSARAFWERARPLNRPHPYLERKGLSPVGCGGLRMHDGLLVVPVMLGDWLISIQTITVEGQKRFWPGAPVKGGALVLARKQAALTCIVEGLATGLAVFQSIRLANVIVAFDAGNLLPAVDRLKPTGSVVMCADNDWRTQDRRGINPGLEKARNVAELIGCGVAYPQGIEGSDFADMLKELGEGSNKKIERLVLAQSKYVMNRSLGAVP